MKISVIIISLLLIITGCTTTATMSTTEKNLAYGEYVKANNLVSKNKIVAFKFTGWQSLTTDYLIITSFVNRKYLLEINGYCNDLNYDHSIYIHQSTSTVLSAKFDSISTASNPQLKCFIKTIYPINKAQAKEIVAIGNTNLTN